MRPGYFRYLNPLTDDWLTVGRIPRRDAISQALEANLHLADRITRDDKHSVDAWVDRFDVDVVPKRDLARHHGRLVKASTLSQTPPTFHEMRYLSARLYEEQGNVDVQILLGHKDPKTTAIYKDSRGTAWQEAKLA